MLPLGLLAALAGWYALTASGAIPAFLLPPPGAVAERFIRGRSDAALARHTPVTSGEVEVCRRK